MNGGRSSEERGGSEGEEGKNGGKREERGSDGGRMEEGVRDGERREERGKGAEVKKEGEEVSGTGMGQSSSTQSTIHPLQAYAHLMTTNSDR